MTSNGLEHRDLFINNFVLDHKCPWISACYPGRRLACEYTETQSTSGTSNIEQTGTNDTNQQLTNALNKDIYLLMTLPLTIYVTQLMSAALGLD